ncbi:MAG: hypothetical protein K2P84_14480 [Undibacterium sp.]|nr:hypothetical protein [Undibacterium sp.]
MKVLAEKSWSYVLMDDGTDWILTFLIGGVVEIDVSIRLTAEEISMIKENPACLDTIVDAAKCSAGSAARGQF